jgi:Zn-dependent peptidase ImmA (M78 family)
MLGAPISTISSLRHERIIQLASAIRERYDPRAIDKVAQQNDIVLVRTAGAIGRDAGFAYIEYVRRPELIESLSHPDRPILVWGGWKREPLYSIVINTNSGIPEAEIFWHEWYHLFHSPHDIQRSERFEHRYSTGGVLHNQEERRADEFAAAVLVPSSEECSTMFDIIERFGVSERLAVNAMKLYARYSENHE